MGVLERHRLSMVVPMCGWKPREKLSSRVTNDLASDLGLERGETRSGDYEIITIELGDNRMTRYVISLFEFSESRRHRC